MKVGAHVSAAAPLAGCVDRARQLGAEALQIFVSGPQSWRPSGHDEAATAATKARALECGIDAFFFHGVYLINLASADDTLVNRSIGSLKQYLRLCSATGSRGTIFHVGSHKGAGFESVLPQIAASMENVLSATPEDSWLILENSAGQGGTVGGRLEELGGIIRAVGSPRIKVCLDTCHLYAAGYDIATSDGCAATLDTFDTVIGLDRLVAVHANDSKAGLGSGLDRHENIGEGQIGRAGFEAITSQPAFRAAPFILEVPGFDGKGPDRRNIAILREIAGLPPLD